MHCLSTLKTHHNWLFSKKNYPDLAYNINSILKRAVTGAVILTNRNRSMYDEYQKLSDVTLL